jgi:hypothetical protein
MSSRGWLVAVDLLLRAADMTIHARTQTFSCVEEELVSGRCPIA